MVTATPFSLVAVVLVAIALSPPLVSAFGAFQRADTSFSAGRYSSSHSSLRQGTKHESSFSLKKRMQELRMSPLADVANEYYNMLSDYPLATQSVTGGIFAGVGDVVAQYKEMQNKDDTRDWVLKCDQPRAKRFMLKGLGGGLVWYSWFNLADQWSAVLCQDLLSPFDVSESMQGNVERLVRTVSSILLEQFIACPLIYALWDIPFPALLDGAPINSIPGQVRDKVPGLLVENAKVWTFVNLVVYNIPLEWRVLATSCTDIFWQSVISSVASAKTQGQELVDEIGRSSPKEDKMKEGTDTAYGYRPKRRQRTFSGAAAVVAKKESR